MSAKMVAPVVVKPEMDSKKAPTGDVVAPASTFDLSLASGAGIPIEQRSGTEITHGFGRQTAPDGAGAVLLDGRWKAIRLHTLSAPIRLFDVEHDLAEKTNVAAQHPSMVAATPAYGGYSSIRSRFSASLIRRAICATPTPTSEADIHHEGAKARSECEIVVKRRAIVSQWFSQGLSPFMESWSVN